MPFKPESQVPLSLETFYYSIIDKSHSLIQEHLNRFGPIVQVQDPERHFRDWIINYAVQTKDLTTVQ